MAQDLQAFPAGFLFGAATASYQIEGAFDEDGRGPSIWDTFAKTPGRVLNAETGDIADDHYHRYVEDVQHMADLGLGAYRFSFAWPRIQPDGKGEFNREGVAFYHRLLDELDKHGIKKLATLYHWDLPQTLEDEGGWPVRATAYHFEKYARFMAEEFGDRIDVWTTLNEPWCAAFLGYSSGAHAPGRSEPAASLAAAHHLNLAHGLAGRAIRSRIPGAQICIALNTHVPRPWDPTNPKDVDAARQIDALANRVFIDPLIKGEYPADLLQDTADVTDWAFVLEGDLDICRGPLDIVGVNYYSSHMVRFNDSIREWSAADGHKKSAFSCWPGADNCEFMPLVGPKTSMTWNIDPSAFTAHLIRMQRDTGLPLMVTENGAAFEDVVGEDGRVHDAERIAYLHGHLAAVLDAIAQGVNVQGYMVWSLLDNFEWGYGFERRFGMIRVDYTTLARIWKDSAYWYQQTIAMGALQPTTIVDGLVH